MFCCLYNFKLPEKAFKTDVIKKLVLSVEQIKEI